MRSLRPPFYALLVALALLYAAWGAGRAPLAPHEVAAALLDLKDPSPRAWLEAFASMWQFVPFLVLPAACWTFRQRAVLAGAGIALAALYLIALGTPMWWLYFYMFLAGAGVVMLGFLAHQSFLARDLERRALARYLTCGALLFAAFGVTTRTFLIYSSGNAAPVLDLSALKLDWVSFGFSPSAWAMETGSSALHRFLAIVYEILPLAMMAVFGLEARAPQRLPFGLLKGLFVCGFAAAIAYAITPVAGPLHVFGTSFPARVEALVNATPGLLDTLPGYRPRNAFPSLDWGWALLIVMLTVRFAWPVRALFGTYALAIAFSTLAFGQHYLVDLVASFPMLLAIAALCVDSVSWRVPERWQALACGLAMYAGWVFLLRPANAHAALDWPLLMFAWCVGNVMLSVHLYGRLMVRGPIAAKVPRF